MKVPKKYAERVYSFEPAGDGFDPEVKYEIVFNDGWQLEDSGYFTANSYREALEIMRYATYLGVDEDGNTNRL